MNSKILAGLSFDPGILIIAMLILMVFMLVYIIRLQKKQAQLEKKYRAFMRGGKGAKSFDEALEKKIEALNDIKDINDRLNERITHVEKSFSRNFQKMGIVKYDAFKEMGGKLSFSLALLNDKNDGCIINSIHSKDGCFNYIKEIIKGESYLPLSDEEQEALEMAKESSLGNE